MCCTEVVAQDIFQAVKRFIEKWCTRIMQSPERHVVEFHDRVRPVIMESDLETNFSIIKETTFSIYERCLKRLNMGETDFKEIPNLEDFEASFQAANNSTVANMGLKRFYLG